MSSKSMIEINGVTKDFRIYERAYGTLKAQSMHVIRQVLHRDMRRNYTLKRALDSVSFEVPRGQTVAIIGQNGSGKSTLLSILTRIYLPTSGEVRIRGRISSLLELGLGFDPELTGIENIFFACTLRANPRLRGA
jgi:lipopolysaccharide transport system ATP-binding protein